MLQSYQFNIIKDISIDMIHPSGSTGILCQKGKEHQGQDIIMICLNNQCQAKRLCCLVCVDELHKKHELISIRKFQNMIKDNLFLNNSLENKKSMEQSLNAFQKQLIEKIQKLNNNINCQLKALKQTVHNKFKELVKTLHVPEWSDEEQRKWLSNINNQSICSYIQQIERMKSNNFGNQSQLVEKIDNYNKQFDKFFSEFSQKYFNKGVKSLEDMFTMMNLGSRAMIPLSLRKFSQVNKAACLKLQDNNTTISRIQGSGGYPIVLMNDPFDNTFNSVSFKILEQPNSHGIWIGIANLQSVKNLNFLSCYGIGKGTYAIDQVGASHQSAYSWSHHSYDHNSKPIVGWTFNIGDVVTISVEEDKSEVVFKKGNQTYRQPIQINLKPFYAFAGPTNLGDKIAIAQ